MTPHEFLTKWRSVELKERTASQSHFIDLCRLLGVEDPISADPRGEWFTFEKGATKTSGGEGWADVWRRGCFAWEYKGRAANLDKAFDQLLRYSIALESPPLLIVSDMERIRIHTNWTNTVQQVHDIGLEELADANTRDLLRNCFTNPEALRPAKTRQMLTEEAAKQFASLAQRLRDRGHEAHAVAHFVNRLVFCMFAEDVGLLTNAMFSRMLEASRGRPAQFADHARVLFAAMKSGGMVGFERVEWFNGGLFDDGEALPLEGADIESLLSAARLDWSEIDPSILGTLFERGLDPDKRSQLGAHYTDRDKILQIVRPVIVEPLEREWREVRARIEAQLTKAEAAQGGARTRAQSEAARHMAEWRQRLQDFRVLDPACGSGNFLNLSLVALKDIEHRTNLEAEQLGLPREFPRIGPENVLGIELNPYAAELARVSVWIGEIQWMRRNGFDAAKNPILRALDTIECRDAIVDVDQETGEVREAGWPPAEAIVGNPPFLGGKSMRGTLGEEITERIRRVYTGRLAPFSDLVCYWFEKCRSMIAARNARRCGLVATKAIAKNVNLPVLVRLSADARIFDAWQNEPWVINGAAVRVSIVCFAREGELVGGPRLNGDEVDRINPNLTTGIDTTAVRSLPENANSVFIGIQQSGPLTVARDLALKWLQSPLNPNGRPNSDVLSAYVSTDDIVGRPTERFLIDFPAGMDEAAASEFEGPFEYLRLAMYDPHRNGQLVSFPEYRISSPDQNSAWWEPHRRRAAMRAALRSVETYLATAETTEHRVFRFLPATAVPDKTLYVFPQLGMVGFGILQSRIHEIWTTYFGNRIGAGNQRRYNASFVYLTFPFPQGLTPNIAPADYADDPRAQAIATAAKRLNELRENWLNPPDLARSEPEVLSGYPDRVVPIDEEAAKELTRRTLTNLYNQRPTWLEHAHRAVDEAVADAYGCGDDFRAGLLTDERVLQRLFQLNQLRARSSGSNSQPDGDA
jgi:hypothetical protein